MEILSLDPPLHPDVSILWLDDVDEVGLAVFTPAVLKELERRHLLVVGTITTARLARLSESRGEISTGARRILPLMTQVRLNFDLLPNERSAAERQYQEEDFNHSIGEPLIAASELLLRFQVARTENPIAFAVMLAAIDWRRAGVARGLSRAELKQLAEQYGNTVRVGLTINQAAFDAALAWTKEPLVSHVPLMYETEQSGRMTLSALDYIVSMVDTVDGPEHIPVAHAIWEFITRNASTHEAFDAAFTAFLRGDMEAACMMWGEVSATESTHAGAAALNLGITYQSRGMLPAAEAAYRRSVECADRDSKLSALLNLGVVLAEMERPGEAESTYRELVQYGDDEQGVMALINLAGLLVDQREAEAKQLLLEALHSNFVEQVARAGMSLAYIERDHFRVSSATKYVQDVVALHVPSIQSIAETELELLRFMEHTIFAGGAGAMWPDGSRAGRELEELDCFFILLPEEQVASNVQLGAAFAHVDEVVQSPTSHSGTATWESFSAGENALLKLVVTHPRVGVLKVLLLAENYSDVLWIALRSHLLLTTQSRLEQFMRDPTVVAGSIGLWVPAAETSVLKELIAQQGWPDGGPEWGVPGRITSMLGRGLAETLRGRTSPSGDCYRCRKELGTAQVNFIAHVLPSADGDEIWCWPAHEWCALPSVLKSSVIVIGPTQTYVATSVVVPVEEQFTVKRRIFRTDSVKTKSYSVLMVLVNPSVDYLQFLVTPAGSVRDMVLDQFRGDEFSEFLGGALDLASLTRATSVTLLDGVLTFGRFDWSLTIDDQLVDLVRANRGVALMVSNAALVSESLEEHQSVDADPGTQP